MRDHIPRGVTALTKRPQKLFRGKLAEAYDGISQSVNVAISDGSTSGAYRARIAAGDFGGGRVFPIGTPVIVYAHHGKLEVLTLGNLPGCKCWETFSEDKTGGWGTGKWNKLWDFYGQGSVENQDTAAFYVSDGSAKVNLISSSGSYDDRYIAVQGYFVYPLELLFKVKVINPLSDWLELRVYFTRATDVVDNGDQQQYVILKGDPAASPATVELNLGTTIGGSSVISRTTKTGLLSGYPNKDFYWKIQATGSTLKHKVWFTDDAEPEDWQSEERRVSTPVLNDPLWIGFYGVYYTGSDLDSFRVEIDSICSQEPIISNPLLGPGTLSFMADDYLGSYTFYVNGTAVSSPTLGAFNQAYNAPIPGDILRVGDNLICVHVQNSNFVNAWSHNPTMFYAKLYVGNRIDYTRADTGKVLKTAWRYGWIADLPAGWYEEDFSDSDWLVPVGYDEKENPAWADPYPQAQYVTPAGSGDTLLDGCTYYLRLHMVL